MNCVPCVTWVKRGAASRNPAKVKLSEEDLAQLVQNMQDTAIDSESDDDGADADVNGATSAVIGSKRKRPSSPVKDEPDSDEDDDEIDKKYELSDYDDEDDPEQGKMKISDVSTFAMTKDDPYLEEDMADSDDEDMAVLPTDNLLAVGKVKKEYCCLEVYVYNEEEENCWCHHDIILPTFPLAMEWMDFDPGEKEAGNFIAMGTMSPDIEIWDLDVVDTLEPAFVLAGAEKKKSKKKKSKQSISGHTDAVLDLSWNSLQRNVLASASADFTIGLWDLQEGKMVSSLTHHTEKVQTLEWHPVEPQTLISGSFDKRAKVYDCRSPNDTLKSWKLPGEVERVKWNHNDPYYFLASSDTGHIYYLDVRADKPVFTLKAHTDAVTGLGLSSSIANCLVTSSGDAEMKVWDISNHQPKQIFSKDLRMGQLHCMSCNPDCGLVYATGGETEFRVMNLKKNPAVAKHFGLTSTASTKEEEEEEEDEIHVMGVTDDEEDDLPDPPVIPKDVKKKKKKKQKSKTSN